MKLILTISNKQANKYSKEVIEEMMNISRIRTEHIFVLYYVND